MNRLIQIAKNKYLLASIAFIVWMCFFDRYDVSTQYNYYQQKKGLEREKLFYESEIERINTSIHDMQFNPDEIQRVAREKFRMKRKNEDIYIISVEDPEDLPQP